MQYTKKILNQLIKYEKKVGTSLAGEGGEFESLVVKSNLLKEIEKLDAEITLTKVDVDKKLENIEKQKEEIQKLKEEVKALKQAAIKEIKPIKKDGINFVIERIDNANLREIATDLKGRIDNLVAFLAGENKGKVTLVTVSKVPEIKAGDLIKEFAPVVGGKGGGKPDFAQGGGKDAGKIDELIKKVKEKFSI